jgi:hypothetical protein
MGSEEDRCIGGDRTDPKRNRRVIEPRIVGRKAPPHPVFIAFSHAFVNPFDPSYRARRFRCAWIPACARMTEGASNSDGQPAILVDSAPKSSYT